jgi:hypothetical protein
MAYVNKFDFNKQCAIQGNQAEEAFKEILLSRGFKVRDADGVEQRNHVDLISTENNKNVRYDVKARKKVSRSDEVYQDELVWVELLNVRGDLGWVYGSSDYLVFEREKDFIVVSREKLADFIQKTCNFRKEAQHSSDALYCKYQRKGRKDLITLIKNSDIESIAKEVIMKT